MCDSLGQNSGLRRFLPAQRRLQPPHGLYGGEWEVGGNWDDPRLLRDPRPHCLLFSKLFHALPPFQSSCSEPARQQTTSCETLVP